MGALVKPLLRLCDAIALVALAVLFGVVAVNVLGRALFDATGQAVNLMIPAKRSVWAAVSNEFRDRRLWIDVGLFPRILTTELLQRHVLRLVRMSD